jgi:1-acyl-sn-glycerol-3-phosphate acyltransferase
MLYLFFWFEAALVTGALYLSISTLHPALILPILIGAFVVINLLFVFYLMITSALFSKKPPERPNRFALLTVRLALPWVATILTIRLSVKGREKMPDTHAVYVANHRSAFDPVFLISAFPRRKRTAFISKLSVSKYPFVGPYMNACGYVFVDRESPMQSMRAIHRAAKHDASVRRDGEAVGGGRCAEIDQRDAARAERRVEVAVMRDDGGGRQCDCKPCGHSDDHHDSPFDAKLDPDAWASPMASRVPHRLN